MRHKTNVLDTKHTVVKHTFVYAKCLIKFVYDIELSHEAFLFLICCILQPGKQDDYVSCFQAAVCVENL